MKATLKTRNYYIAQSITRNNPDYNPKNLGRTIVRWYKRHKDLDYSLTHMYVYKRDENGHKRGDQTFTKPLDGSKYRDIYFYNEVTRKALRELIPVFDWYSPVQIGFTAEKGIQDLENWSEDFQESQKIIKLDLEDAFNSITSKQIFWLLREVFDLSKEVSNILAKAWTTNGHMIQGHPLAPLFFNLLTRDISEKINETITLVQYADDIILISKKDFISYGLLRRICRSYTKRGFRINPDKTTFIWSPEQKAWTHLGLVRKDGRWLPAHRHEVRKKALYLENGGAKREVTEGLWAWYSFVPEKIQSQKWGDSKGKREYKSQKQPKIPPNSRSKSHFPDWLAWVNPAALPENLRKLAI